MEKLIFLGLFAITFLTSFQGIQMNIKKNKPILGKKLVSTASRNIIEKYSMLLLLIVCTVAIIISSIKYESTSTYYLYLLCLIGGYCYPIVLHQCFIDDEELGLYQNGICAPAGIGLYKKLSQYRVAYDKDSHVYIVTVSTNKAFSILPYSLKIREEDIQKTERTLKLNRLQLNNENPSMFKRKEKD